MDNQEIKLMTDEEVRIAKCNQLALSILDGNADRLLFQSLLLQTEDNDRGIQLQQEIDRIDQTLELLEKKLKIIQGMA